MHCLPASFYLSDTIDVARALLGKVLVRTWNGKRLSGRIVETEAYLDNDEACHAHKGITPRTRTMFEQGGRTYVYLIYGMYNCLNIVTEVQGRGCAVLIRALEPLEGIEEMARLRKKDKLPELASGPGKLAQALHITGAENNLEVSGGSVITVEDHGFSPSGITATGRIGITRARDLPYRFYITGNPFISQP